MSSDARQLLSAPTSTALSLLVAVEKTFGSAFAWEPETLWITCEQADVDLPVVNSAKIQAGIALMYVPSFYWDGVVFEKTALAFSDIVPNPESLQEATPAQLAWAVVEAGLIGERFGLEKFDFETEPKVYAAVVLHRAGFVLAPPELTFAQEQLDRLNRGGEELRTMVAERLAQLGSLDPANHSFDESPAGVQLGYLAAVKLYVADKRQQLEAELSRR